jgi:hypothetical protein
MSSLPSRVFPGKSDSEVSTQRMCPTLLQQDFWKRGTQSKDRNRSHGSGLKLSGREGEKNFGGQPPMRAVPVRPSLRTQLTVFPVRLNL